MNQWIGHYIVQVEAEEMINRAMYWCCAIIQDLAHQDSIRDSFQFFRTLYGLRFVCIHRRVNVHKL